MAFVGRNKMNTGEFGKKLIECVSIDEKKISVLVVEEVVLHALKKVVEDTSNPFDDSAYAMLAPILAPKAEEALSELIAKLKD